MLHKKHKFLTNFFLFLSIFLGFGISQTFALPGFVVDGGNAANSTGPCIGKTVCHISGDVTYSDITLVNGAKLSHRQGTLTVTNDFRIGWDGATPTDAFFVGQNLVVGHQLYMRGNNSVLWLNSNLTSDPVSTDHNAWAGSTYYDLHVTNTDTAFRGLYLYPGTGTASIKLHNVNVNSRAYIRSGGTTPTFTTFANGYVSVDGIGYVNAIKMDIAGYLRYKSDLSLSMGGSYYVYVSGGASTTIADSTLFSGAGFAVDGNLTVSGNASANIILSGALASHGKNFYVGGNANIATLASLQTGKMYVGSALAATGITNFAILDVAEKDDETKANIDLATGSGFSINTSTANFANSSIQSNGFLEISATTWKSQNLNVNGYKDISGERVGIYMYGNSDRTIYGSIFAGGGSIWIGNSTTPDDGNVFLLRKAGVTTNGNLKVYRSNSTITDNSTNAPNTTPAANTSLFTQFYNAALAGNGGTITVLTGSWINQNYMIDGDITAGAGAGSNYGYTSSNSGSFISTFARNMVISKACFTIRPTSYVRVPEGIQLQFRDASNTIINTQQLKPNITGRMCFDVNTYLAKSIIVSNMRYNLANTSGFLLGEVEFWGVPADTANIITGSQQDIVFQNGSYEIGGTMTSNNLNITSTSTKKINFIQYDNDAVINTLSGSTMSTIDASGTIITHSTGNEGGLKFITDNMNVGSGVLIDVSNRGYLGGNYLSVDISGIKGLSGNVIPGINIVGGGKTPQGGAGGYGPAGGGGGGGMNSDIPNYFFSEWATSAGGNTTCWSSSNYTIPYSGYYRVRNYGINHPGVQRNGSWFMGPYSANCSRVDNYTTSFLTKGDTISAYSCYNWSCGAGSTRSYVGLQYLGVGHTPGGGGGGNIGFGGVGGNGETSCTNAENGYNVIGNTRGGNGGYITLANRGLGNNWTGGGGEPKCKGGGGGAGSNSDSNPYRLGSGGAAGGSLVNGNFVNNRGGNGGGIIRISTNTLNLTGKLYANGKNGGDYSLNNGTNNYSGTPFTIYHGAGGGGAGGSILIRSKTLTCNSGNAIQVNGGAGGAGVSSLYGGGGGGGGAIAYYYTTLSGTCGSSVTAGAAGASGGGSAGQTGLVYTSVGTTFDVTKSRVIIENSPAQANGSQAVTVRTYLLDVNGVPLEGEYLVAEVVGSLGTGKINNGNPLPQTDANGMVTFPITSTVAGIKKVILKNAVTYMELQEQPTLTFGIPQISISKTANKSSINSGDIVTYTITLTNTGAGDAGGDLENAVIIEDVLPTGFTYTTTGPTGGSRWDTGGGTASSYLSPQVSGDGSAGNEQRLKYSIADSVSGPLTIPAGGIVRILFDVKAP